MSSENETLTLSRRAFLSKSAILGGGLVVAFYVPQMAQKAFAQSAAQPPAQSYPPNAFIQITPDGQITMIINRLEMGQGVHTSMAQLIAEELECDWKEIKSKSSGVDAVYNSPGMPMQITGGSMSLRTSWDQYRKIGAGMREMLKAAAAQKWGVSINDVRAENGMVVNTRNRLQLTYGELAEAASKLEFPQNPPLKKTKDFKVIGKSPKRLDSMDKVNGKAVFGIDVRLPGMLYVAIARPTFETGTLKSFDVKAAKKVTGVVDVVKFKNKVAVLAKNTYAARKACDALKAKWTYGAFAKTSSESLMASYKEQAKKGGKSAAKRGAVDAELKNSKTTFEAEYEFPFLAHASMEPLNCTINYDGKTAELWGGHQMPGMDLAVAAKVLGLKPENVKVNVTYAGGSFGRRASKDSDYIMEACELAKIVKKPLKVVWSREDDMRGGYYRPMYHHKAIIGLNDKNQVQSWKHHITGQSIMAHSVMAMMIKDGIDPTSVEGVSDTPYKFENFSCDYTMTEAPVKSLWWRSVGHTHTAYVMETMMDELAEKAGQDPFAYRRQLLKDSPRHLAVLDLLEKKRKHVEKLPEGHAWGLAVHESFESVVGYIVDVSLQNGMPKVHRVWGAVDCGQVVHPEGAKTQVEGGLMFGLSAVFQKLEIKNGEILETNFDRYPVLRMQDTPVVDVEFVKSEANPTGLGEPGVPPIAPAVMNAVYKLTKKRVRKLPYAGEEKV